MAPRLRCATRERRMRGRPAPGRAPPRPVGLNSMLVCRGWWRRRACRGRRLRVFRGRRFPCTRRHLCDPAFEKEATRNYCICQQYFCSSVSSEQNIALFMRAKRTKRGTTIGCTVARRATSARPVRKGRCSVGSLVTRHTKNCPRRRRPRRRRTRRPRPRALEIENETFNALRAVRLPLEHFGQGRDTLAAVLGRAGPPQTASRSSPCNIVSCKGICPKVRHMRQST